MVTVGDVKTQRNQTQLLDWSDATVADKELVVWITDQPLPQQMDYSSSTVLLLSDFSDPVNQGEHFRQVHDGGANQTVNQLAGKAALDLWAETISAELIQAGRDGNLPVAQAQKPPMTNRTAVLVACGLGLLTAIACFGFYYVSTTKIAELRTSIDALNAQKKQLNLDNQALNKAEKSLSEMRSQVGEMRTRNGKLKLDLEKAKQMRKFQQTRWLKLVTALADSNEGDCWVRGLQANGLDVKVQGLAVSNRDIALFASNLERLATPHGWRVHPAQMERTGTSLIEFEINLNASNHRPGRSSAVSGTDSPSRQELVSDQTP